MVKLKGKLNEFFCCCGTKFDIRPLQVGFLFLVSNFPKSGEGKREIRNLETFLLPVSGQRVTRPTMHTAVH